MHEFHAIWRSITETKSYFKAIARLQLTPQYLRINRFQIKSIRRQARISDFTANNTPPPLRFFPDLS